MCTLKLCGLVIKSYPTLVTPWTVTHQAPLFMEFSRWEYWSGLSFPSPGEDNFSVHQNNLEGLLKHWSLGPKTKIFNSVGMEASLKIYISNKFLDEGVAIAWRTSLWKALVVYDMILTCSVQDRDNSHLKEFVVTSGKYLCK